MATHRRRIGPVLGFTLALAALTACSSSGSDGAPTSTTRRSAEDAGQAGGAGADDVVWQQSQTRGQLSPIGPPVPAVTIYGDGRIFVADVDDGTTTVRVGSVDLDELDALLHDADGSGLFEPGTDFGAPNAMSLSSLDVTALIDGTLRTATVLQPGIEDTELGTAKRMTAAQVERRQQLDDLDIQARALASGLTAWDPDQVRAVAGVPAPGEELTDPELVSELEPQPWPGPSFDAFPEPKAGNGPSCLVLEGPDAKAALDAAERNVDGFWSDDDQVWPIVLTPLLPGAEGCPPS